MTAYCKGGPGKTVCGEIVLRTDPGVCCDKCDYWFHSSCQGVPLPAYEALVQFKVLSWFCPECKKTLKNQDNTKHLILLESKVDQLEKSMKEHTKLFTQSMKEQEQAMDNQTKMMERSVRELHSQKSSYADIVKGTCSEVVEKVSAKISTIPQTSSALAEAKSMPGITKVFDEFIDKDRRKNNLVIHNLPEAVGGSLEDRSARDIQLFQEVTKDTFRMHVAVTRSFRVGKRVENKDRLLIVTLETPGVKQEILRMAPQLRTSAKWGNVYITPDLTRTEREAARRVREELVARRQGGEKNLTIRKGKIVTVDVVATTSEAHSTASASLAVPASASDSTKSRDVNSGSTPPTSQPDSGQAVNKD